MPQISLTEDEYIAELNRQLKQHHYYCEGMAFVPSPEGATGKNMLGYSVTGPFSKMGVYAMVAHRVAKRFCLKI